MIYSPQLNGVNHMSHVINPTVAQLQSEWTYAPVPIHEVFKQIGFKEWRPHFTWFKIGACFIQLWTVNKNSPCFSRSLYIHMGVSQVVKLQDPNVSNTSYPCPAQSIRITTLLLSFLPKYYFHLQFGCIQMQMSFAPSWFGRKCTPYF